jgi:hypothetical protein
MPREIIVTGIHLHANAASCFHHCRYCQLKSYRLRPAPLERFVALVERFIEWRNDGHEDFEIAPWYGNSHDYSSATMKALCELEKKLGWKSHVVLLGGVAHRPRQEMKQWLLERRDLGIDTVVATFSGHGGRHDHWNNMAGNYQFQLDALHLATELGMKLQQRILLIRDSVPSLDELLDDLDRIPTAIRERWAIPLFYSGVARGLEEQRLTEVEIDWLPVRLKNCLRDDRPHWRSEKKWIEHVRQSRDDEAEAMAIGLQLDEQSLDWAEARSCDQIITELEARWRAAHLVAPSRKELCEGYADIANDRLYFNVQQMEKAWFDRYKKDNICRFDINATKFA